MGGLRNLHPHADDNACLSVLRCTHGRQQCRDSNAETVSPAQADLPTAKWLRPLGVTTIAVVVALSLHEHPAPALHGNGLPVTVALLVLVASIVALLRLAQARLEWLPALAAMIVASSALVWTQHGGPGRSGTVHRGRLRGDAPVDTPGRLAMLVLAAATFAAAPHTRIARSA